MVSWELLFNHKEVGFFSPLQGAVVKFRVKNAMTERKESGMQQAALACHGYTLGFLLHYNRQRMASLKPGEIRNGRLALEDAVII